MTDMNRIDKIIVACLLVVMIPALIASGQDKKIRAEKDGSDAIGGSKQYVITTTVTDGNDTGKEVTKEVRVISSESDNRSGHDNARCKQARYEELANEGKYSYTVVSEDKESGSDMAKYVISKNGLRITVEGSDYDKVKEVIKNIEKTLEEPGQTK
jgi:hypothetical protein